ncbi:ABC transporter transmembrane domain-containing protein, partial [Frederiksenia canicola]
MTTSSTPPHRPAWHFSLTEALILQGNAVGITLPKQDLTFLSTSTEAASAPYFQDMQLDVSCVAPDWKNVTLPAIAVFNEGNDTETPYYAVVHAVDDCTVLVATDTYSLSLPLNEFVPQQLLVLRKSLDKIYAEQAIPSETGHWFWRVFRQEMPVFNKVLIAAFFANLLAAVASFFSLQVYDRVIPTKSEETLWALLIGVLIAFALEAALRIARSNLLDYSGKKIDIQSSAFLLRRLMGLRLKADSPSPNHLSQMMREFNSVREFFTEAAVGSLIDIPFAILFLFIIYLIGGQVVWVAIIAIILMVLPPLMFRGKMMKIIASTLGARGAANRLYQETTYQLDTVKMTQAERFFEK